MRPLTAEDRAITLDEVLLSRERRAARQQELLRTCKCSVISFTMNIAGPTKTSSLIRRGFWAGVQTLEQQLPPHTIRQRQHTLEPTGCEALYAVDMPPEPLKKICLSIEEGSTLGRLFDMDVITPEGDKLSRQTQRGCIVCGAPGRGCAAGRLHSISQLQEATTRILTGHFAQADALAIAALCTQSLLQEVNTTPKPGLVDRHNNGSHRDMSLQTFIRSALALEPYFARCVQLGQDTATLPPEQTFCQLRQAGIEAEAEMYRTTGGVNTHKGAIYTMGLLCGSIGRLWKPTAPVTSLEAILSQCARMGSCALKDFSAASESTAGQRLYRQYGLTGIRGEVAAGLPSVTGIGLPVYREGLANGLSANDAAAATLIHLIAGTIDTNLYHRGGPEGSAFARQTAQQLIIRNPYPDRASLEQMDDAFIARNLSPGGCADLLAVTCFLSALVKVFPPEK